MLLSKEFNQNGKNCSGIIYLCFYIDISLNFTWFQETYLVSYIVNVASFFLFVYDLFDLQYKSFPFLSFLYIFNTAFELL